jgi:dynein heavy chain
VYDYYVDEQTGDMTPWEKIVPNFTYTHGNFSSIFVPNVESTRISYFLDSLIANKHLVMLVGSTGELPCSCATMLV